MNIVLAGFMGVGKSTAGSLAAQRLGWPYFSTDEEIARRAGMSIPALFDAQGEAAFRTLEAEVCAAAAAQPALLIDTGGGALMQPQTRALFLAHGLVICLHASLEVILRRVGGDAGRPLLRDQAALRALYAQRAPIYAGLPHQISTAGRTPEEIAEEIVHLWQISRLT